MKVFICYDGRAKNGDTDKSDVLAVVHVQGSSQRALAEIAAHNEGLAGHDFVWFEFDAEHVDSERLVLKTMRTDLSAL